MTPIPPFSGLHPSLSPARAALLSALPACATLLLSLPACTCGQVGDSAGPPPDTGPGPDSADSGPDTGPADDSGPPDDTGTSGAPVLGPPEGPAIAVLVPTSAQEWEAVDLALTVAGSASADVVAVRWACDTGGGGTADGTAAWSVALELPEGLSRCTFTAAEADGDEGEVHLDLLWQPQVRFGGPPRFGARVLEPGASNPVTVRIETALEVTEAHVALACPGGDLETALAATGDGTWEGTFVAPNREDECVARARALVGGVERMSLSIPVRILALPDAARLEELDALTLDLGGRLAVQAEQEGWDAARATGVAELAARSDVSLVVWGDDGLWWRTTEGFLLGLWVEDEDRAGVPPRARGAERDTRVRRAPPPPAVFATGFPDLDLGDLPARNVLDIEAIDGAPAPVGDWLETWLAASTSPPVTLERYHGEQATVSAFLGLGSGITHIQAHGLVAYPDGCARYGATFAFPAWWPCGAGQGPFAFRLNDVTNVAWAQTWEADLLAANLALGRVILVRAADGSGTVRSAPGYYQAVYVLPGFADDHLLTGDLADAVVLFGSCHSADDGALADVLLDKGAAVYSGFTGSPWTAYSDAFFTALLGRWLTDDGLADAWNGAWEDLGRLGSTEWAVAEGWEVDPSDVSAYPAVTAAHDTPTLGNLVEDGSFEEDSARWVFGGDGERSRTVHGTWAPHAGTWMANLEMDWRTSQAYAYATHDLDLLALAPGCYDLSFWYRVVAEAPVVSPSGTYPWFVVRADPGPWTDLPSGGEIWFVLRPSDWYSAATTTDGSTYSTPWTWQTTTWEVTAQVPQPWLTFQVGTSIDDYDVHVLVDEVSLTVGTCGT